MPRYFTKEAAGTPLRINGEYVRFEPVGNIGGSIVGVVQASEETAKGIDEIAKRFGITEITEEEYLAATAARHNASQTRPVDAMQPVVPQPPTEKPKAAKPQPIKDDPRAVVKTGKV